MHPFALLVPAALSAFLSTPDLALRTVEADGREVAEASLGGFERPVLAGFRLRYIGADHQVRRLGLRVQNGASKGFLSDANGGDDMGMRASYRSIASYKPSGASASCRGTCSVPVVARPVAVNGETWRLVLVGFSFEVPSGVLGVDRKVKLVSIRPAADESSYRVELRDNGSFDYKVHVQYAWIRAGKSGRITVTGARAASERTQAVKLGAIGNAPMLISGFAAEFGNGDHHLGELAFERDTDLQYYARFNDANYDDPMTASLDLVWVR